MTRRARWRGVPVRAAIGLLVAVVAVPGLLASCGVPTMEEPAALGSELIPPPARTSDVAAGGAETQATAPRLYFVMGDDGLRPVRREAVAVPPSGQAKAMLAELMRGPSDAEKSAGLSSAIPPGLTLRLVTLSAGRAVVDVEGADPGPGGNASHLLPGQVVLSLTSLPFVQSVSLTRNGVPLEAALPDGALTEQPLTRSDYTSLVVH